MIQKIKKVNDALYIRSEISSEMVKSPILIVEDDKVDAMSIKRAFKDADITCRLDIVSNGEEAMKYIKNKGKPNPGIVFLDLNMPKMNGIEFLKVANNDIALHKIPIIVMSTSDFDQEKEECFNLNASGYMVKSIDYNEFVELIKMINIFWAMNKK